MAQHATQISNGVNVDQLMHTIESIQANPDLAKCQFRAETEWRSGGHVRTEIRDFYAAGQEDTSRREPFILEGDEPPVLLGENNAPNAVETVLHALAACLAVGFVYNAAAQGINIDHLSFEMHGDLDLRSFLGIDQSRRPGYDNIRLTYRVESDAPREKITELCEYVQQTSPVLDMLRNPVPVSVELVS